MDVQQAYDDNKDTAFPNLLHQFMTGALSYRDAFSYRTQEYKQAFDKYMGEKGVSLPVPLRGEALTALQNLTPILDSLKNFKAQVKNFANDDTPGKYLLDRFGYLLGHSGDEGGLMSLAEMERIRAAAQAMTGTSKNLTTLEQAQVHTPNMWKDSGKLINDKLDNLINYLEDLEKSTYKFGAKTGVVQGGPTAGATPPTGGGTSPAPQVAKAAKYITDPQTRRVKLNPDWKP